MSDFLKQAIKLSSNSAQAGGYPVGAIVVMNGRIIAEGLSDGKNIHDATSHAEIAAIRAMSIKLGKRDLFDCEIYSSMEPCLMCFSACYWAKIKKITYAIGKDKLSAHHYEGTFRLDEINEKVNKPLEILQLKDLEVEALSVVEDWEKNRKK